MEQKKVWQFILELYMESGFSHAQRNWLLLDIVSLTILDSEKVKSDDFFFMFLTWPFNVHYAWMMHEIQINISPTEPVFAEMCHDLFTDYHTVLPAVWFVILALKTSAMLHGFGQKWQPEGISSIMVISNTAFTTANCKNVLRNPGLLLKYAINTQRNQTLKC